MLDNLKYIISNLPDTPGIYLFYDKKGELIYVGKASSLRNRVRSYWNGVPSPAEHILSRQVYSRPIEQLLHEVTDIKWKQTDSALEAAILEANYIKKYLPKYNVIGKDNKSWNYVVITKDEYPRVITMREHEFQTLKHENMKT